MTKIKTAIICVSIVVLFATPKNALGAESENFEPSFNYALSSKTVSSNSQETALSQYGLDHIGHGLFFLTLLGLLALRKR